MATPYPLCATSHPYRTAQPHARLSGQAGCIANIEYARAHDLGQPPQPGGTTDSKKLVAHVGPKDVVGELCEVLGVNEARGSR